MNIETPEKKEQRPEDIIGFLREYYFGDRDDSASTIVARFKEWANGVHPEGKPSLREISGSPDENFKLTELLVEELEKAGFVESGEVPKDSWSTQMGEALTRVVQAFETYPPEKQAKLSKEHEDGRF